MNARLAVEENKMMVTELLESSKEMATRLGITVDEAIDKKVAVYVKRAKNETEASAWELRGDEAKKLNLTYDIFFNDDENSNNTGFKSSLEYCKTWIEMHNGSNHSYLQDYKGGTVSIVCNETGETVFETEIL